MSMMKVCYEHVMCSPHGLGVIDRSLGGVICGHDYVSVQATGLRALII